MKRKFLAAVLAGAMVFSLTACGNSTEKDNKGTETKKEDTEKELEDTLVVYSTHSEDMLEVISDAFTEETGVEVEFINLKGELADRVRSEKDNPQADIMFGGDTATYMLLQEEGCYEATEPSWAGDLADDYKDADGYWYGTYKTPVVMCYNSELMTAEEAPKDWKDLADPKYADQIVTRDSLSSSMRSSIAALVSYYSANEGEEAAWNYIEALCGNIKNYYNSGSMMFQALGKGEAAVSMAVLDNIIDNRDNNDMPLEIIDAESGAITITDCIAAIKDAPHPNAAAAFIEFVGSAECEEMVANEFNRMPALDAALENSPEWMKTGYEPMDLDWSVISKNQSEWLEKWETDYIDANSVVASK
ncbi:ABC transporter substrate-binding protein [Drancourtella sp. An210]|nr:extracellular solute-binding protein [uncultured Sellimonas sp.]OUO99193.1 ABC transporter substrate-binding protein [Drancourtella sp. An210]OUP65861.1 ABC transporter substrate-binding protein [Drancourtella sp. An177]